MSLLWKVGESVDIKDITDNRAGPKKNEPPALQSSPPFVPAQAAITGTKRTLPTNSPEKSYLPLPKTPANRFVSEELGSTIAPSSEYYTAAWGSPYDVSPSNFSRSVRTAISEQREDDYLSSPDQPFDLEHLIPSRFSDLALPESDFDDNEDAFQTLPSIGPAELTPRPTNNRWVSLPRREAPERPQWWTEGAGDSGSERDVSRLLESPTEATHSRGHRSREANRTLDQQSFWETVRDGQPAEMTSLMSSRWATGPADEQQEATKSWAEEVESQAERDAASTQITSTNQDAAEPDAGSLDTEESLPKVIAETTQGETTAPDNALMRESSQDAVAGAEPDISIADEKTYPNDDGAGEPKATVTHAPVIEIAEEIVEPRSQSPVKEVPIPLDVLRLEPPRLKKRVSWRGKNCVINIPYIDYAQHGLPVPLSVEELRQHMEQFETGEYVPAFDETDEGQMHNKSVYPEEINAKHWIENNRPRIALPDLNAWKNYMDAVTEAKLAALGVELGDEEPVMDIPRQSASPFAQAFSPPISTSSAAGMRPSFLRGHSHTRSVASPISPLNGVFGHMHRHSTFSLSPMQAQELARQSALGGLQSFSPQPPMQVPSPFDILRNSLGDYRGPGSPLIKSMTPDIGPEFSKLRQAAFGEQPTTPVTTFPQQISTLHEVPEEDGEVSDPPSYVSPQKRAAVNEDIAVPTPRGHRHNISESLEREVMQTEHHDKAKPNTRINGFGQAAQLFGKVSDQVPGEKDPLGGDFAVSQAAHNRKKSATRFNVAAPAFVFNPAASFQPGASTFTFPAAAPTVAPLTAPSFLKHTRQTSSGNFNAAAAEFKPSGLFNFSASLSEESKPAEIPPTDFSFSMNGPSFDPDASIVSMTADQSDVDGPSSIFGNISIPDIIKPVRKSKAIAILHPSELSSKSASATDAEDSYGRPERSHERQKRSRMISRRSGDDIPRFAEPLPAPSLAEVPILPSQPAEKFATAEKPLPQLPHDEDDRTDRDAVLEPTPRHQLTSSLSAMAKPWQPTQPALPEEEDEDKESSVRSLDDNEITQPAKPNGFTFPSAPHHHAQPSFADIDAAMQFMNADDEPVKAPQRTFSPIAEDAYAAQDGVQYISEWPRSDAPSPSPRRKLASPPPFDAHSGRPDMNGWAHINKLNKSRGPPSDWSDMLSPADDHKLQTRSSFFDGHVDDVIGRALNDRLRPFEEALLNIQTSLDKRSPSLRRQRSKQRSSSAIESDADDEDDDLEQLQRPISRGRDQKLGQFKAVVMEALREQSPVRQQSSYDIADLHSALADMKVSFARVASTSLELDDIRAIVEDVVSKQTQQSQALVPIEAAAVDASVEHKREITQLEERLNETLIKSLEQVNTIVAVEQREAEARRMLKLAEEELKLLRETAADDASRVRSLEEEHARLADQLEDAEDAQSKAEARYEGMRAENQSLTVEIDALSSTLAEYRLSSDKWRAEADQHEIERQTLHNDVAVLRAEADEHEVERQTLHNDVAVLRAEIEQRALERDSLQDQIVLSKATADEHILERQTLHNNAALLQADADKHEVERQTLQNQVAVLQRQVVESQETGSGMRRRLEKLHGDLAVAMGQLTSETGRWKTREESYRMQCDALETKTALLTREKHQLEDEVIALRAKSAEFDGLRQSHDSLRGENTSLNQIISGLQTEIAEKHKLALRFEQEASDAKDAARTEVQRMRSTLELDVEAANHRVNVVRAELENDIAKAKAELDGVRLEADTATEKHALLLEAEGEARREALQKLAQTNAEALQVVKADYTQSLDAANAKYTAALTETNAKYNETLVELQAGHENKFRSMQEQYQNLLSTAQEKYESTIAEMNRQHTRQVSHAVEDKERSEYILNERLALADAKLQHFQDRILHLEERVEVAKSAAQAAVINVQSTRSAASPVRTLPEKVSPQALRESILVLQEQLQDRETKIEALERKLRREGPAKIKERDTEITWLRELLAVRNEELGDLVNTLSKPTFDRDAVRDTAIRIRANLQMEQQEKEKYSLNSNIPSQAIASFSNFATPKAAQLTSMFDKWRASMESSALKSRPASRTRASATPSRAVSGAKTYGTTGLMTPPASNLRNSPTPEAQPSVPAPKLASRRESQVKPIDMKEIESKAQDEPQPATPTLLENDDYDDDAEDRPAAVEDEDLDVPDSEPPAFRSLEDELNEPEDAGAEAEEEI